MWDRALRAVEGLVKAGVPLEEAARRVAPNYLMEPADLVRLVRERERPRRHS